MSDQPSFLKRMALAWRYFRQGDSRYPTHRKASPYNWPSFRENQPQWQITDYASYVGEGFQQNSLIYEAIAFKARTSQLAPFRAYGGDPEHPEVLPLSHPLAKLISRPNKYQSGLEFQAQCEAYLNLAGDVFIHLDRPKPGKLPQAMRTLRPDRVFIVPEKDSIKGYIYVPEGKSARVQDPQAAGLVPLLPDDVMHIKLPNPADPLEGMGYGLSPISAAAYSADVDNSISRFLKAFFDRGTMLAGALQFEADLDDATINHIQERWKEKYGGWENMASEIAVLGSGGKYQRLTMGFDEMGFDAIDKRNETRILGVLGVPLILLGSRAGIEASTLANFEQSERHYWTNTLKPEIQMFEAEYSYYLRDGDAYVAADFSEVTAFQKDTSKLVEAAYKLWQMGAPANIAIAAVGLDVPTLPGGDVGYLPATVVPVGTPRPAPAPAASPIPSPDESAPAPSPEPAAEPTAEGAAAATEETRKGVVLPFRRPQHCGADVGAEGRAMAETGPDCDGLGVEDCGCGGNLLRVGSAGGAGDAG